MPAGMRPARRPRGRTRVANTDLQSGQESQTKAMLKALLLQQSASRFGGLLGPFSGTSRFLESCNAHLSRPPRSPAEGRGGVTKGRKQVQASIAEHSQGAPRQHPLAQRRIADSGSASTGAGETCSEGAGTGRAGYDLPPCHGYSTHFQLAPKSKKASRVARKT